MSVLSIQTRRIDGLTEATTAEDEDLLLIRKADGSGTRNIKRKNLIPKVVDKVGDLKELTTADKTSVVKAVNEIRNKVDVRAYDNANRFTRVESVANNANELVGYVVQDNAASHNNIYRGKDLGRSFTSAQRQGIKDGTFKDLYVGDYFTFGNNKLYVAHLDYFLQARTGSVRYSLEHHVVLVPSQIIGYSEFDQNGSGYYNSALRKTIESLTIKGTIGDIPYIKNVHVTVIYNASTKDNLYSFYRDIECSAGALTSQMVIGQDIFCRYEDANHYLPSFQQMALFRHNPLLLRTNELWWLADMATIGYAISVDEFGTFYKNSLRSRIGVRPFFVITVERTS